MLSPTLMRPILPLYLLSIASLATAETFPITDELYAQFIRYTKFSAAAYANNCPIPPNGASVAQFFDITSTDTQAYLFQDDAAEEFIVSFRGTSTIHDFVVDFDQALVPFEAVGIEGCEGCMVHGGYLDAWNSASSQIISSITTGMDANPTYALTVTGHSLGASLASLASASLANPSLNLGVNITTYTFGQPRTGNPAFADYIDSLLPEGKMFRVTHSNDGVPQTITVQDGYRHHSTEYWENDPAGAGNTVRCEGQEPADCNNSVRGTGLGANATGINAAHLVYSGVSVGNPLDGGRSACNGS